MQIISLEPSKSCDVRDFCQYKCQCSKNCKDDFQCSENDTCKPGWFGYRCQYQDLAVSGATVFTDPSGRRTDWMTDQDDNTCNNEEDLKSVTLSWEYSKAIPLTWTRLTVSKPHSLLNVALQFTKEETNEKFSCVNETLAEVTNNTLDKRCNDDVMITSLTLSGNLSSLCSFYISGGRNIAYKQNASQSSVYTDSKEYTADLAVDGNNNSNFYAGSCSHTKEETSPSWTLTLQSSYFIHRLILYNRENGKKNSQNSFYTDGQDDQLTGYAERLRGFVLDTYDMNLTKIGFYKDNKESGLPIYHINIKESMKTAVKVLTLRLHGSTKILTLCEVEAFGECPSGRWSLPCSKPCPASCPDTCDRDTGACNSICIGYSNPPQCNTVCTSGKWGINCRYNCSNRCAMAMCNVETGLCDQGCHGYSDPPYCSTVCSRDRWGINCSHRCSEHCHNPTCNNVSGECHQGCKPGYLLPDCTMECPKGQWGVNCTSTCSENCFNKLCNPKEGSCDFGCVEGFQTPDCLQNCFSGTYGRNCSYNCSSLCVNEECDPVNGACNRCPTGFKGHACELKIFRVEFTSFGIGIAVGSGAIFVVVLVVQLILCNTGVLLWRPRSRFAPDETNLQLEEAHTYDQILKKAHRDGEVNAGYETSVLTSPDWTEYSTAESVCAYVNAKQLPQL
ncbi:platelet endothelial aggregation receptor 1 [Biomphalaria glabrata]|nr:platelet endothelial aggregation receptor 1 [Biomphalaria glabrata]